VTIPSGNGETRGPESADPQGTKLPGTRPSRAAANNARHADFLGATPVADQDGFGTEDMHHPAAYLGSENIRPSDVVAVPPILASEGDGGEPFGGA
jgi:hypothetical protein